MTNPDAALVREAAEALHSEAHSFQSATDYAGYVKRGEALVALFIKLRSLADRMEGQPMAIKAMEPCACGGKPTMTEIHIYQVVCAGCGSEGGEYESESIAAKDWNESLPEGGADQ